MAKKTLDLLDAHFTKKLYDDYDSLGTNPRFSSSHETFIIDPNYWEKHYANLQHYKFSWQEIKYDSQPNITDIIKSDLPGIYMFYIKPNVYIYDLPKFVLYIGISGATESLRPLKDRLSDYFRVKQIKKRDALERLLGKYYHYVHIAYSLMDLDTNALKHLETNLIGFYYPIANKDDFPVEIEKPRKAFNKR